jgi:hypothetical protein
VMEAAREYLTVPDANFDWSSWADQESALEEVDAILARLRENHIPPGISVLFLPTGPLQEVSLSSGWGNEFIALAARFDAALARARESRALQR